MGFRDEYKDTIVGNDGEEYQSTPIGYKKNGKLYSIAGIDEVTGKPVMELQDPEEQSKGIDIEKANKEIYGSEYNKFKPLFPETEKYGIQSQSGNKQISSEKYMNLYTTGGQMKSNPNMPSIKKTSEKNETIDTSKSPKTEPLKAKSGTKTSEKKEKIYKVPEDMARLYANLAAGKDKEHNLKRPYSSNVLANIFGAALEGAGEAGIDKLAKEASSAEGKKTFMEKILPAYEKIEGKKFTDKAGNFTGEITPEQENSLKMNDARIQNELDHLADTIKIMYAKGLAQNDIRLRGAVEDYQAQAKYLSPGLQAAANDKLKELISTVKK
jgi:hypothetical protein